MMKMRLRPSKCGDGKEVVKWIDGERQMRMWCRDNFVYPLTEEQMEDYYRKLESDETAWGFTAIDEAGRPVGSFCITVTDYETNRAHMGFIIVSPEMRGQGAGQQMVALAVKYAVELLGMERITLKVFACNPAAKRCYEKVGFKEAEYMAEDYSYGDEVWGNSLMVYEKAENFCF